MPSCCDGVGRDGVGWGRVGWGVWLGAVVGWGGVPFGHRFLGERNAALP